MTCGSQTVVNLITAINHHRTVASTAYIPRTLHPVSPSQKCRLHRRIGNTGAPLSCTRCLGYCNHTYRPHIKTRYIAGTLAEIVLLVFHSASSNTDCTIEHQLHYGTLGLISACCQMSQSQFYHYHCLKLPMKLEGP